MRGQLMLYLDQYGNRYFASTVKELQRQIPGKVSRMYCDSKDGKTLHTGYVIGQHWLSAFTPFAQEVC